LELIECWGESPAATSANIGRHGLGNGSKASRVPRTTSERISRCKIRTYELPIEISEGGRHFPGFWGAVLAAPAIPPDEGSELLVALGGYFPQRK
jgi:hypothetical protein